MAAAHGLHPVPVPTSRATKRSLRRAAGDEMEVAMLRAAVDARRAEPIAQPAAGGTDAAAGLSLTVHVHANRNHNLVVEMRMPNPRPQFPPRRRGTSIFLTLCTSLQVAHRMSPRRSIATSGKKQANV